MGQPRRVSTARSSCGDGWALIALLPVARDKSVWLPKFGQECDQIAVANDSKSKCSESRHIYFLRFKDGVPNSFLGCWTFCFGAAECVFDLVTSRCGCFVFSLISLISLLLCGLLWKEFVSMCVKSSLRGNVVSPSSSVGRALAF